MKTKKQKEKKSLKNPLFMKKSPSLKLNLLKQSTSPLGSKKIGSPNHFTRREDFSATKNEYDLMSDAIKLRFQNEVQREKEKLKKDEKYVGDMGNAKNTHFLGDKKSLPLLSKGLPHTLRFRNNSQNNLSRFNTSRSQRKLSENSQAES